MVSDNVVLCGNSATLKCVHLNQPCTLSITLILMMVILLEQLKGTDFEKHVYMLYTHRYKDLVKDDM